MEVDLYLDDWWLVFEHQQTKELHSLIKMLLSGLWSLAVRLLEDERISSSVSLVAGVKIFVNDVSNVLVYKYNPVEKKKNNNCFIPTLKMFIREFRTIQWGNEEIMLLLYLSKSDNNTKITNIKFMSFFLTIIRVMFTIHTHTNKRVIIHWAFRWRQVIKSRKAALIKELLSLFEREWASSPS